MDGLDLSVDPAGKPPAGTRWGNCLFGRFYCALLLADYLSGGAHAAHPNVVGWRGAGVERRRVCGVALEALAASSARELIVGFLFLAPPRLLFQNDDGDDIFWTL